MKPFFYILTIIIIFAALSGIGAGIAVLSLLNISRAASAGEYALPDFMAGYDNFSITTGISKSQGRYYSYHYEFTD